MSAVVQLVRSSIQLGGGRGHLSLSGVLRSTRHIYICGPSSSIRPRRRARPSLLPGVGGEIGSDRAQVSATTPNASSLDLNPHRVEASDIFAVPTRTRLEDRVHPTPFVLVL